ncbi:hypothetical protein E5288_WYG020445 [Bos mutus]|uniref:Uncharacterized protein n=1 Tax=Bos mutus TaxID=72004 RepID=A0A6B0S787_9CETA|nr:hypothetical protein [Bos mutus]
MEESPLEEEASTSKYMAGLDAKNKGRQWLFSVQTEREVGKSGSQVVRERLGQPGLIHHPCNLPPDLSSWFCERLVETNILSRGMYVCLPDLGHQRIALNSVHLERTQKVLRMSTNFGSGKRNKNSIQLESEFQSYSSRSPDHQVKWTKFYMRIQRTSESPSTCNKGPSGMFPLLESSYQIWQVSDHLVTMRQEANGQMHT